jgi:hypothetical protein
VDYRGGEDNTGSLYTTHIFGAAIVLGVSAVVSGKRPSENPDTPFTWRKSWIAALAADEQVEGGGDPARLDSAPLHHGSVRRVERRHPVEERAGDVAADVGDNEAGVAPQDERHEVLRPGEAHGGEEADHHLEELALFSRMHLVHCLVKQM